MKGFGYFSDWLIEGRQGILQELEAEFRSYENQLEVARKRVAQLEMELGKWRTNGKGGGGAGWDNLIGGNGGGRGQGGGAGTEQPGPSSSIQRGEQVKQAQPQLLNGSDRGHLPNLSMQLASAKRKLLEPGSSDAEDSRNYLKVQKKGSPSIFGHPPRPPARAPVGTQSRESLPGSNPVKVDDSEVKRLLWTPIVESCVPNCDVEIRRRSLQLLTNAPIPLANQVELLHLVCNLIKKGQQKNWNSSQLFHALKLLESLLSNPTMKLEDHTNYMINTICGLYPDCRPTSMEAWEVLDLGSSLLGMMSQMWGAVRDTMTQLFTFRLSQVLEFSNGKGLPLMTLYNTIRTLKQMGKDAVGRLVLPNIRRIGERLRLAWQSANTCEFPEVDSVTIVKIQDMIVEVTAPILVEEEGKGKHRGTLQGYEKDVGKYFGKRLFERVQEFRKQK